jgi:hypothetical protein
MTGPGGDLAQRPENEVPQMQPRMRDDELGRLDDEIPGKQDVDVDRPRSLGERADALHLGLDPLRQPKKLGGLELRPDLEDLIEEPRLVRVVDGLGLINGGGPDHLDPFPLEKPAGPGQVRRAPPQVAAEA